MVPKFRTITKTTEKPFIQGVGMISIPVFALAVSCSPNQSHIIEADESARVVSKYESTNRDDFNRGEAWRSTFTLVVEQCNREDDALANTEGCITLAVDVSESTYDAFESGEEIFFIRNMDGTPLRDQS